MLKSPKFDRVTELLDQIQKDFQTSSENIGKIKGLLEEKPEPEINSYEDVINHFFPNGGSWYLDRDDFGNGHTSEQSTDDTIKYIKRKLIAEYYGARDFTEGKENYYLSKKDGKWDVINLLFKTEIEGIKFFPSREQAQKYLDICLKEGLL